MNRVITATAEFGEGAWTSHGKARIAQHMLKKGRAFVGTAILLRRQGGDEFVVLHLLCQGIEILGKGYLLSADYETYHPRLRKRYGHNLLKLLRKVEQVSGLNLLKGEAYIQLKELNSLYSRHQLRYGSALDVLIDPASITSVAVIRRLAAVLRYADKHSALG